MSKLLGIDYGKKRIGLAVSDEEEKFSFARETLENKSKINIFDELQKYCIEEEIKKIIIGLPLNMKGQASEWTEEVKKFKKNLENKLNIPCQFQDERMTSRLSHNLFQNKKVSQKVSKNKINEQSARIILQDYIDRQSLK
ncbi:MAG: Holliday junction resolvase RuvX [Patescibacteria group bacterium]|nr:Holliday junction resolvase RuvX [Patescibacteria group bacterium]